MRKTMKMWRWFLQQRQSFLANQVVLSGRRKAQGIASSGRTKSLRPSLNLWWCWIWGEEKILVCPMRLHLVSWLKKSPINASHPFSNLFTSHAQCRSRSLCFWSSPCLFESNCTGVGWSLEHILEQLVFEVYCTRVDLHLVYLEHMVQEVAHERRRVLVGACYVDHRVTGRQEACKGGFFF